MGNRAMSMDIKTVGKRPVMTPLIQLGTWSMNLRKWTLFVRESMFEMEPTKATGIAQKRMRVQTNAIVAE
jgi:hypothetical protein